MSATRFLFVASLACCLLLPGTRGPARAAGAGTAGAVDAGTGAASAVAGTSAGGAVAAAPGTGPQRAAARSYTPKVGQLGKDVVWVPTSQAMADLMLNMAGLTADDRLVDLGSGDGVLVIRAAQRGARAHGIEYNPDLVALAKRRARAAGVAARATFEQGDLFETDFSDATVVTLFLLPELNLRLRPVLQRMRPGTRVVSNSFDMGDWTPDARAEAGDGCTHYCEAMLWIVPAPVAGLWRLNDGRSLELAQSFQKVGGVVRDGGPQQVILDAGMDGARIRFSVGEDRYEAEVAGAVMQGTVNGTRPWSARKVADP